MAKHCVNHKSPEVISIADVLEINPIIAAAKIALWQERNNIYDRFPSMKEITEFSNKLNEQNVDSGIKVDEDSYYYESKDINGNNVIPSKWTNATLKNNPKIAKNIITKLKELYPEVVIQEDGILTNDGLYIPLNDASGMHYRDAFISAVSWANDSSIDTPPHEYIHHYLDMYRNHPLVKQAISNYGKENLTRSITRHYMNYEMSGTFNKFISEFWDMVKSLFGNSDIQKELARSFRKGESLGNKESGSGELSFSMSEQQNKSNVFFSDVKSRFNGTFNVHGNFTEEKMNPIQSEIAKKFIVNEFADLVDPLTGQFIDGITDDFIKRYFSGIATKLWVELQKVDTVNNKYRNSPLLHEKTIVEDLLPYLTSNDDTINDVIKSFITGDDANLVGKPKEMHDLLIRMQQRILYASKVNESYYSNRGKLIDKRKVDLHIDKEVKNNIKKKEQVYSKVKNKYVRESLKWVESKLMSKNINKLTLSMILSGSEKSAFTEFFYRSLDNSNKKFNNHYLRTSDMLSLEKKPEGYENWSYITSGKKNIDKLVGEVFNFTLDNENKRVKLTNQEILSMYMMSRQNDPMQHGKVPPLDALLESGIHLDDIIEGRDIMITDNLKISKPELERLITYVESNPTMVEMVSKMDSTSDYIHELTNDTFKQEMGYDLPKMEKYFPVKVGQKNLNIKNSFSELEGLSSAKERLGEKKPLLIGDALSVYNGYKDSAILYSTHALEVSNNRKLLNELRPKYSHKKDMAIYFDQIEGTLNKIETGGTLYASRGEKDLEQGLNKLTSNLSVSALAYNVPVLFKQPVSYLAAQMEIDGKYLKKAGWGVGPISGVKPGQIARSLKYTGINDGESKLPFEWHFPKDDPSLKEIMDHSPTLTMRTMGTINRETGEAFLDLKTGDDKINIPGTNLSISKKRSMAGIVTFDTATMVQIWDAVKLETEDKYPQLEKGSYEYWEHVASRTEEVFSKTQPTHAIVDQSPLEESTNPIARIFTMFGSPRSKLANLFAQNVLRYASNPTKENLKRMTSTLMNIGVYTGVSLAAIDVLFGALRGRFDDDDQMKDAAIMSFTSNTLGTFWGLGELSRMVMSRIDNAPWTANLEHPFQTLVSKSTDVVGHIYNGDYDKAAFKLAGVMANATGFPATPIGYSKDIYEGMFSEK